MPPSPSPSPPAATARLFAHHRATALDRAAGRSFVALRLAEEGDRRDLRWLLKVRGEAELRRILARHGERQLSRRSLAFWRRVLDLPAPPARTHGDELWPR